MSGYNLNIIEQHIYRYAEAPEKNQATRILKKNFDKSTTAEVFTGMREFIENELISDKDLLQKLRNSVKILISKEIKQGSKHSILHKTNWIADFFRLIFNPRYFIQRLLEINKARNELNLLRKAIEKKIRDQEIEDRWQKFDISENRLNASKEQFITFINQSNEFENFISDNQKKWLDPSFVQFFHSDGFQNLMNESILEFQILSNQREQILFLNEFFKQARQRLLAYSKQSYLGAEEIQQVMILLLLKLDISRDLMKVESQLTPEELKQDVGLTLAYLTGAMIYLVKSTTLPS
ncbi:MAG: hypothetical protein ACHQUC_06655 [Chlamydiales bacterium]